MKAFLTLTIILIIFPIIIGKLLINRTDDNKILKQWISGQFLMWALFQMVSIPIIFKEGKLETIINKYFSIVLILVIIGVAGLIYQVIANRKRKEASTTSKKLTINLIMIFMMAGIFLQILCILFLAINDGDDSFYMSVASISNSSGSMYVVDPYSPIQMILNPRYALAPFPIWIAMLSRVSGVHTLIIGHIILGVVLLLFYYGIHYILVQKLSIKNTRIFMFFIILLTIWGNISTRVATSFLITRTRQGKALVASIVIPMLWYLMTKFAKDMELNKKIGVRDYILVIVTLMTGALGSAIGGVIVVLLWGTFSLITVISYKRFLVLIPAAICCIPNFIYIGIYLGIIK